VSVTVIRPGEVAKKEFSIERGSIPIESVNAAFMVNDSVGYMRIERFAEKTYDEFIEITNYLSLN
jgi:carboxyl-terminal processing protease